MNPATLALIVQGLQAAITAAPGVISVAEQAYALIAALFSAQAISAEQQDALKAHIDGVMEAVLNEQTPPHWQVEPDPQTERSES
jgi:hypothetical protein